MNVKINKKILITITAAAGFIILVCLTGNKKEKVDKLERPGYGENSENIPLIVEYDGEEKPLNITINPVVLTLEQLDAAFEETFEEVCDVICGENNSLNEVNTDLIFENKVGRYAMNIEYFSDNYDVINAMGEVNNVGMMENCICNITISINYREFYREYENMRYRLQLLQNRFQQSSCLKIIFQGS